MKPSRRHSLPLSASSWTLYQEVFEDECALTGVQRTTAINACYFVIGCRGSFDPDNFVLRPAVGTIERHRWGIRHIREIAYSRVEIKPPEWTVRPEIITFVNLT